MWGLGIFSKLDQTEIDIIHSFAKRNFFYKLVHSDNLNVYDVYYYYIHNLDNIVSDGVFDEKFFWKSADFELVLSSGRNDFLNYRQVVEGKRRNEQIIESALCFDLRNFSKQQIERKLNEIIPHPYLLPDIAKKILIKVKEDLHDDQNASTLWGKKKAIIKLCDNLVSNLHTKTGVVELSRIKNVEMLLDQVFSQIILDECNDSHLHQAIVEWDTQKLLEWCIQDYRYVILFDSYFESIKWHILSYIYLGQIRRRMR